MDATTSAPGPTLISRSSSRSQSLSPDTGSEEGPAQKGQVLVFSLSNRPKQSRASAPKSRNGCRECRRRHIKCDQARPHCMKCTKSGRACDGYLDSASSRSLPALARRDPKVLPTTATDTRILKMIGYETALFGEQKDWESFQAFAVSVESGDTLVVDYVSAMTPQYATTQADSAAVRQICCGIATLSKAYQVITEDGIDTAEYRRALEHYGRGVRAITSLKPTTTTLPSTILTSLLFQCFEWMAGHAEATRKHHSHAVAMLWQYVDLLVEEQGVPLKRLNLSEMEQSMFDTLERLDTHPWLEGIGPTAEVKPWSAARRFPHGCRHRLDMAEIPESFNSTQQASTWWHFTQHCMAHSLHPLKTSKATEGEKAAAYDECAALLESWHSAFKPLLLHTKQHRSSNLSRWSRALTLESLYVETVSALHSRHRRDSNVLPAVQPIYRALIAMAGQLARERPLSGIETLGMENSIVRPIVFVLLKCRDPDIVRQARAVLEGLRGGIQMAWTVLYSLSGGKKTRCSDYCDRAWGWYLSISGCSSGAHIFNGIL